MLVESNNKFKRFFVTAGIDVIAYVLAFYLSNYIRFNTFSFLSNLVDNSFVLLGVGIVAAVVASFVVNGSFSYRDIISRDFVTEFLLTSAVVLITIASGVFCLFFLKTAVLFSRLRISYLFGLFVFFDFLFTTVFKWVERSRTTVKKTGAVQPVFIYTNVGEVDNVIRLFDEQSSANVRIMGVLVDGDYSSDKFRVFRDADEALQFICHNWVDDVFVSLADGILTSSKFVMSCLEMGVDVHLDYKGNARDVFIDRLGDKTVLSLSNFHKNGTVLFIKRLFDIVGGLVGSVFAIILTVIVGPLIFIASPGPVFFVQKRVGKNGRIFKFVKFRSMYTDAEARKAELLKDNRVKDGMMFKLDFDPRIIGNRVLANGKKRTGLGEFLRKTSIDEVPQFFNVLLGSMSLVGTRPPTLDEWGKYGFKHRARLAMKPGITGNWQVSGRSDIRDFEEVVKLDMEYINNFTLGYDVKLMAKTLGVVCKRNGAL